MIVNQTLVNGVLAMNTFNKFIFTIWDMFIYIGSWEGVAAMRAVHKIILAAIRMFKKIFFEESFSTTFILTKYSLIVAITFVLF
jgi:hypothetical protein